MQVIDIKTIISKEQQGSLSFFEGEKDVPFKIKRIYYTYNVPLEGVRGGHAHKNLQQLIFCPYGAIKVILDNGFSKSELLLDKPDKGLIIDYGIWRDLIWEKENSVLCVAASNYYNEDDYIRNYDEFLKLVKGGYWNEN